MYKETSVNTTNLVQSNISTTVTTVVNYIAENVTSVMPNATDVPDKRPVCDPVTEFWE